MIVQQQRPTWDDLQETLRNLLGVAFDRWFALVTATIEEAEDGVLVLRVIAPDTFQRDWIRENYCTTIEPLWLSLTPKGKVLFTAKEKRTETPEPVKGHVMLFPRWADTRRATARAIFRSALFPALGRGKRKYLENQKIYSTRGVEIFFTGKQFDQSDLDVYLEVLHILKDQPGGTDCEFSAYGLLKTIGRPTAGNHHKWLHAVLIRLTAGVVDITDHHKRYFGTLLQGGIKDEVSKHYTISVNPKFVELLDDTWASLDCGVRQRLGKNQTAKALHGYYSTHAAAGIHDFATLAAIVGLTNGTNKRMVKARLINAHKLMQNENFLEGYEVTNTGIQAYVNHTASQNRHIANNTMQGRKKVSKSTT